MSVLPLMPASTNGKWNVMSSPHFAYKIERPTYCTPAPVENIPSNNECNMVEVRGHKVAGFNLSDVQYICLPQAFEYFLKNLVGGLHTVYTKLKRLNISPVVCNVEQVRILRGLGAIQPGVNRCKLITMKDFEILYQDCTTASRPGRPPKRYFPLTYSNPNEQPASQLQLETTQTQFRKRARSSNKTEDEKTDETNSVKEIEGNSGRPFPFFQLDQHNVHNTAGLSYIQQTLRNQYQQLFALTGIQNGSEQSQINPALSQFLMMSNPSIVAPTITPSIAMLNHFNRQISQRQFPTNVAMLKNRSLSEKQKNNCLYTEEDNKRNSESVRESAAEEYADIANRKYSFSSEKDQINERNGIGSPRSNHYVDVEHNSDLSALKQPILEEPKETFEPINSNTSHESSEENSSPTQTFLIQIQGLLKLAVNSAGFHEAQATKQIIQLEEKLQQEIKMRKTIQRQLDDCKKDKNEARKKLRREKEKRNRLDNQLFTLQNMLRHQSNNAASDCEETKTIPKQASPLLQQDETNYIRPDGSRFISMSPVTSSVRSCSVSSSTEMKPRITEKAITSPELSLSSRSNSPLMNVNNNSNNASPVSDNLYSPEAMKQSMASGQHQVFFNNHVMLSSALSQ